MRLTHWLRSLVSRTPEAPRRAARPANRFRPRLEALEDRTLLSTGWAVGNGGTAAFDPYAVLSKPDAAGNLYVTGYFTGSASFGATTLSSATKSDYVAKVGPNGNFLWAQQLGGSAGFTIPGIGLDGSGNVYVAGNFGGTATFGGTTLTSAGGTDIFVTKLDATGNVLWARQAGGATDDFADALTVDPAGNVFFTGAQASWSAFLTKMDTSGNTLWSEQLAGGAISRPFGITGDGSGNVYVVGDATGFLGSTNNGFVEKIDTGGKTVWAQGTAETVFTAAFYQDPVTGATSLYTTSVSNVQKRDASSGAILWSEDLGTPAMALGRATAVDASGDLYVTGQFSGTGDFDPGSGTAYLTSKNSWDDFLVKLGPSGNFLSARRMGADLGSGLALDSGGNVYTAGQYQGTADFDTGTQTVSLTSPGSASLFVCKTTQDMGNIFGRVSNDLNANGAFDPASAETGVPGVTVYLDSNNNGVLDAGEPTAVTGAQGLYEFDHLVAGNYTVREVLPAGWAQTSPAGGAGVAAAVAAGTSAETIDFEIYTPSHTRTYASSNVPVKTTNGKNTKNAISTLTISDPYTIFDLHVTLNVSNTKNYSLTVNLVGPDGTVVTLVPYSNVNGTLTFETPAYNYKKVTGTWKLEVDNLAGGTLNSWSLTGLESNF